MIDETAIQLELVSLAVSDERSVLGAKLGLNEFNVEPADKLLREEVGILRNMVRTAVWGQQRLEYLAEQEVALKYPR